MPPSLFTVLRLERDAPAKPAFGSPCNGCGVCCAAETCPLGMVVFRRRRGPCPALSWDRENKRYLCGLVEACSGIPLLAGLSRRLVARWIAAGRGCDSRAEIMAAPDPF